MGPFIIATMPADGTKKAGGKVAVHHASVVAVEDVNGKWREIVMRVGNEVCVQSAAESLEEILRMLQQARRSDVLEIVHEVDAG